MSNILLSTGISLLAASGVVSLPSPPGPIIIPSGGSALKTRAELEALKTDLTLTGSQIAVASMKVPGVDTLPAGATITNLANKTMSIASGQTATFVGWDLMNWKITAGSSGNGADLVCTNCRIGRDSSMSGENNCVDSYGSVTISYCDMIGHFGGADTPGGLRTHFILHRDASKSHIYRYNRIRGTISDPIKLRKGELVGNYFDPIVTVGRTPTANNPAGTYSAGDLVTEPGNWAGTASAHIWKAKVNGAPGSEISATGYAKSGTTSWEYINPHADQMTLPGTGGAVLIQGNYFNDVEASRYYTIGWVAANGHNNNIRLDGSGTPMTHQVTVRNNLLKDNPTVGSNMIAVTDQGISGYVPVTIDYNHIVAAAGPSKPLEGYNSFNNNVLWHSNWKDDGSLWALPQGAHGAPAITLAALPFDGFVFDAASGATAIGVLRGTAHPYASVQARGEGAGGNTSWETAEADGSGAWLASISLSASAGEWYAPAARYGTDDASKVTSANKFAAGDVHVFAGQSEVEHILAVASAYNGNAYPTLLTHNLTMITQANSGSREIRRITSTGIGTVNVAMVALANLFHRARPGRKILIIDCAVSGKSRSSLHNDTDTTFNWSDLQITIDDIRGAGGEIGHWTECWYNSDAATIKTFGASWAPFYMGQRWGGGAFTLGASNPDDGRGQINHVLWDIEAAAGDYGRGAFKRNRTKLNLLTPMVFCDTQDTEQRNFTHDSAGSVLNTRIKNLDRPARDTLDAFGADSRVQTFLGGVGPSAHVVDFGGGIHPLPNDPYGTPQFVMLFAPAVLRSSGYAIYEPTIDTANVSRGGGGAYADVPVLLPNGGTLTTLRALRSIAAPGTEPPHYQSVIGFEIRRAADGDGGRRPVMKATETGYPSGYRGAVTIQDSGSNYGGVRKGIVRITPTDAFAAGDMLEYLRGEANGHILESRDVTARTFLNMLIEHIPVLYFPADTYPFCGVPVKPQPPMMTLA